MAGRSVSVLLLAGCFLAKLLVGSTGTATLFQPGNASFSTQQDSAYWLSENGDCTFGFKNISADEYLLSVWFTNDSNKTSLWWPAKLKGSNNPEVKTGAIFDFTSQGSLELSDATSNVIWSSGNISSVAFAELQDTGNLVLLDKSKGILWQSFADLRDSLMLPKYGGSADVALVVNKPYLLQSRENQTSFVSGRFHLATDHQQNLYLHALYQHHNVDFIYMYASMNVSGSFEIGQDYGKTFYSNGSMPVSRLTLDEDGNLRIYSWESSARSWQEIWQIVDDKCKLGSPCGPFGICDEVAGGRINCTCPPGYHAIDVHDDSQGCGSSINFSAICGTPSAGGMSGELIMVEMADSDYYYNDLNGGQPDVGIEQCKTLCLNTCTCMAASHRNDNTCFLKGNDTTGYLMNGYTTNGNNLLFKVVGDASGSGVKKGQAIRGGVAGVVVAAAIVCCAWLLWQRRNGRARWFNIMRWTVGEENELLDVSDAGPVRFTYQQLVEVTNNFSHLLGEGGFGKVYKGWMEGKMPGIGTTERVAVAVKVLKGGSTAIHQGGAENRIRHADEGEKQFRAEVSTLGKIHHVNLVRLLGYCTGGRAGEQRALVFEYMENGSLDRFLWRDAAMQQPLAWATRYSIALGTARGIAYLHHDCSPRILHCDIKPQNVLIGHDFSAKVADFGFARRFHLRESHLTISGMRGTPGYMAPEWLTSDEVSSKVDVFSFGMLLLELVRGPNMVNDRESLLDWAFQSISAAVILPQEGAAARSDENINADVEPVAQSLPDQQEALQKLQFLRIGLWCIQHMPSMRPPMSRVVQFIEGTIALEDPPNPSPQMTITRLPSFLSDSEQTSTSYVNSSSSYATFSTSVLSGR